MHGYKVGFVFPAKVRRVLNPDHLIEIEVNAVIE